ncbi:hypothetical protein [Microlunatus flavus]|uniref:Uncharacterized protein n=1 Tax=Microlunatus flavus TaxID=1036181 RepID=A0A1H9FS44_9ACTN|nr:hypothetical protein [Microlunatus flavus]SEQ40686.1 hypothetical protein SAMN05421756_103362 [Microlunatus flavus]
MRLDPVSEDFRLRVDDTADAMRLVGRYAARRGTVLEESASQVVFRVGSPLLFLLLDTFSARGRRSLPVKITVSVPAHQTSPWLHVTMESQERGFVVRARWLVAAFQGCFCVLHTELQGVTKPEAPDA